MPIYQYECSFCGHKFKELQTMSEDALTDCPECENTYHNGQKNTLKKIIGMPMVIFKGSGFHCTDYPTAGQAASNNRAQAEVAAQAEKDHIKDH